MTARTVDLDKLRVALRRLGRDDLQMIAERAIGLVPRAKLRALVGDMVQLETVAQGTVGAAPVLREVRKFHQASVRGEYHESFNVNSKNFREKSRGTETFIAEFRRLLATCIRAAENEPRAPLRDAFELLFELLRRIDEDADSVVFFADEGGSWQVGVDWRAALPAYFRCIADNAPGEDFAREVDRAIKGFAEHERPRHLTAARRVANAEQKAALRCLSARARGR